MYGSNLRHHTKFHQNRSNGCGDMVINFFSKTTAVRHLKFDGAVFGPPTMST